MNYTASNSYKGEGRYMQRWLVRQCINRLTFRATDVVLDVGCGTGEETKSIAARVNSVTGIDISEEMLAIAQTTNSAPNITYLLEDAQTVGANPSCKDRFDKAVSFCVLHWVPDQVMALESILASLKQEGEALFIIANETPLFKEASLFMKSHKRWSEYWTELEGYDNYWSDSLAETEELFTRCGWVIITCGHQELLPFNEVCTKLFLKTLLGQTAKVPQDLREEYLEDLWQWAMSKYHHETLRECIKYPGEMTVVHASKPAE